jgi:hypothetical protein
MPLTTSPASTLSLLFPSLVLPRRPFAAPAAKTGYPAPNRHRNLENLARLQYPQTAPRILRTTLPRLPIKYPHAEYVGAEQESAVFVSADQSEYDHF